MTENADGVGERRKGGSMGDASELGAGDEEVKMGVGGKWCTTGTGVATPRALASFASR